MIKLFQLLFIGHCHKWKIIKEVTVGEEFTTAKWTRYYLQCEVCGKVTKKG